MWLYFTVAVSFGPAFSISFLAVQARSSCSSFNNSQSRKHRLAEVFRLIGAGSDLDLYIIREQNPELVQTHLQQASFGDSRWIQKVFC